jgi:hypothetical protein
VPDVFNASKNCIDAIAPSTSSASVLISRVSRARPFELELDEEEDDTAFEADFLDFGGIFFF